MASHLLAAPAQAAGRTAARGSARLVPAVSSLRVRPFKASRQQQVKPCRAAAAEAPVDDLDFEFNYGDAKRNNEYNASDVEAALRFFEGEEVAEPQPNTTFATNQTGLEDASFFDDIDNNEAYDADEYIIAGIPEAAPKKRGRGRRDGAGAEEDDDVTREAKELERMKALEDARILEAALEDEFGSAATTEEAQLRVGQPGVWDWLMDDSTEASDEAAAKLAGSRLLAVKHSSAELPEDEVVMASLGQLNLEEIDQETRDMLELVVGDGDLAAEDMRSLETPEDANDVPDVEALSEADAARMDALAAQQLEQLQLEDVPLPQGVPALAASEALDKSAVDQYIASLSAAAARGSDLTDEQVKAMFTSDSDPLELVSADASQNDGDDAAALSAKEPVSPGDNMDFSEVDQLVITAEEESLYEIKEIRRELMQLSAIDMLEENDVPDDLQLETLSEYLQLAEEFQVAEDQRKADVVAAIQRGEESGEALAEDLEDVADMEDDLLADMDEQDMDDAAAAEEEEDGENWQERILELTRVTKVVKGGKLMGFRCVAVVGNGNGLVGVGCQAGREVAVAVKRTLVDAKKNVVRVPLVGAGTIPHRTEAKFHAARCVVLPAADGTGVLAGGAIRSVLELAGVQNVLAKRLGCRSQLNNARATVKALQQLKTLNEVAAARGLPMDMLLLPQ